MSLSAVFVIVGKNDNPLYECELGAKKDEQKQLSQFVLHSALDMVDEKMWASNSKYLKVVDRFANLLISAFVSPGNVRLLLLHEKKDEDSVKQFFAEVYELYLHVLLNPFYKLNSPIASAAFDNKVKALGKRLLA